MNDPKRSDETRERFLANARQHFLQNGTAGRTSCGASCRDHIQSPRIAATTACKCSGVAS